MLESAIFALGCPLLVVVGFIYILNAPTRQSKVLDVKRSIRHINHLKFMTDNYGEDEKWKWDYQ